MSDTSPITALVPGELRPIPGRTLLQTGEGGAYTCLDLAKSAHKSLLRKALNGDSAAGGELIGQMLSIVYYLICQGGSVDEESGEVVPYERTYLWMTDQSCLRFGSAGVARSVRIYDALERQGPWNPPWRAVLCQRQLPGGRRWLWLKDADADDGTKVTPTKQK